MRTKKVFASGVMAALAVAGGLGMALWPASEADASAHIRKFTGALVGIQNSDALVTVHNAHPTYTAKVTVIMRTQAGPETARVPLTIPPNQTRGTNAPCPGFDGWCTLEVSTPNAFLHPSATYVSSLTNSWVHVYAGDFSR